MAVISKKICEQKLSLWLEAEEKIATSQSYEMGSRRLTRADLKQVREEIDYWQGKLNEAELAESSTGRNRVYRFVPRDL